MEAATRFVTLPGDDREFAEHVRGIMRRLDGAASPESAVTELVRELLPTYPFVLVRQQTSLAALADERVWYVYRDGESPQVEVLQAPDLLEHA